MWRGDHCDHHHNDIHHHNLHIIMMDMIIINFVMLVGEVAGRGCSTKEKMYYVHCEVSMGTMIMIMVVMIMMTNVMTGS